LGFGQSPLATFFPFRSFCRLLRLSPVACGLLPILLACCLLPASRAQSTNGLITGRVTDSSKAIIPGARVTLTEMDKNISYSFLTDETGNYFASNLPLGEFRIEIVKPGFRTVIKPRVVVHVQDALEINFEMVLGAVSESVTVEGGEPLMDTESAT